MTTLKCRLSEALGAAKALGEQIASTTIVDSIVCIDGTEIIGAFLAEELTRAGVYSMNAHNTIYIVPRNIQMQESFISEKIWFP